MSNNAVLAALRRPGIGKKEMTGYGFRTMARTILDEVLGFRPDFIEHQLAHAVRDPNGRAYNRTAYLPERRKMMQEWADYLDQLKVDVEIMPIKQIVSSGVVEVLATFGLCLAVRVVVARGDRLPCGDSTGRIAGYSPEVPFVRFAPV